MPGANKQGVKRPCDTPGKESAEIQNGKNQTPIGEKGKAGQGVKSACKSAKKPRNRENQVEGIPQQDKLALATPGPGSGQRKRGRPSKKDLAEKQELAVRLEREGANKSVQEGE
jgi:hypothetical protein